MGLRRLFVILYLVIFCMSCSSISSVKVNSEYDPEIDFSALQSYDWFPFPGKNIRYGLIIKQIKNEMNMQLKVRGFKKISSNPDFFIALHGGIQPRLGFTEWQYLHEHYEPYALKRRIDIINYADDTFIIDFIDTKTKILIYRAIVTAYISIEPTQEKREEKIREAIAKVLENYQQIKSK